MERAVIFTGNYPEWGPTVDDDRYDHLLVLAKAAATLPEPFRRRSVLGFLGERMLAATPEAGFRGEFPDNPGPIEPLILAAYPVIGRFWRAWLHDPLSANELIHLLATTAATGMVDRQRRDNLLRPVVARFPGDLAVDTAETVVRWLADHPDAEELLHPSVFAYFNRSSEQGELLGEPEDQSSALKPADPGKKPEVGTALTHRDTSRHIAVAGRAVGRVRGAIRRQRRDLGPLIKREQRSDESINATVLRLQTEGKLTLPGHGKEENLRRELIREVDEIWDEIKLEC